MEGMEQMCLTEIQSCVPHYYAMEKHKDGGGIGLTKFLIFLLVKKFSNQTNQKTNNRLLDICQSPRRASWFS